jgi:hypothetical protein
MGSDRFGRERVPARQQRIDAGSLRQASVITGGHLVAPSRESFRPSDRQVNAGAIPNRASANQRFFSNTRQGATVQAGRPQGGVNRGGNTAGTLPQQNAARPGFRSFGSNNSGNTNRGPGSEQTARPSQGSTQGSRGFVPPSSQQAPSSQSARPGWQQFTPPSHSSQPETGGRNFGGQGGVQSRPNFSSPAPPAESTRQFQNNPRGSSGSSGYSRPPLNMQQPVVTPRGGGSYSAPRSAPSGGYSGGGSSGGGNRGGSTGGGNRGGYSGGGSRGSSSGGSSSSSGGHSTSGHNGR